MSPAEGQEMDIERGSLGTKGHCYVKARNNFYKPFKKNETQKDSDKKRKRGWGGQGGCGANKHQVLCRAHSGDALLVLSLPATAPCFFLICSLLITAWSESGCHCVAWISGRLVTLASASGGLGLRAWVTTPSYLWFPLRSRPLLSQLKQVGSFFFFPLLLTEYVFLIFLISHRNFPSPLSLLVVSEETKTRQNQGSVHHDSYIMNSKHRAGNTSSIQMPSCPEG